MSKRYLAAAALLGLALAAPQAHAQIVGPTPLPEPGYGTAEGGSAPPLPSQGYEGGPTINVTPPQALPSVGDPRYMGIWPPPPARRAR